MAFNSGGGGSGVGACWERNMFVPPREDPKVTSLIRRRASRAEHTTAQSSRPKEATEATAESWVGTFTIVEEDDTAGQLLRHALTEDSKVLGAGYYKPHPLENIMKLHVQTRIDDHPLHAVDRAIDRCLAQLGQLARLCPPHPS